jgi:hypothetical protein
MTPEGKVKAKVKRALATLPGHYHFMPVQNGMGAPALDFFCCWRGKFFAIETKVPGKTMTERQQSTAAQIIAADGQVFLCDTDESIARMLSDLKMQARAEFCKKYPTLPCP